MYPYTIKNFIIKNMEKPNNIFHEFQEKKKNICDLASQALKAGWLNQNTYNNIISKINEDKLTIGVIGQMKCGKSTFLNSFLFGHQLLPAATTPMTAALSVITYGDKKEIIAEFYTQNEWEELKTLVSRDENEVSDSQTKSSIKAAKELYERSYQIKSELQSLLGNTKVDKFDNLINYVGADGKYVSIVKSVKITLPEEWLKGVEIVDTPGFNDPVVSREERTKEFLKHADVVLMMLYAGRAFDSTDRDILFDKVRRVGVGKIILAVNKYDIQLTQGETPEQIKENVKDEIHKAMRDYRDESLNELLCDLNPILVSAQMALLAKMPLTDINADNNLKFHYNKICDDFEISRQEQFLKLSRIHDLEESVKDIITNQKEKILIEKPKNLILAKANNAIDEINVTLTLLKKKKEELSMTDDELDQRISNLERGQSRIRRKIENAEEDLGEEFETVSTKLFREIQDLADNTKMECERIIDNNKRDTLRRKLEDRMGRFESREFPRKLEDVKMKLKRAFNNTLHQLIDDIEKVLNKYVDDTDEISESFIKTMKKGLNLDLQYNQNSDYSDNSKVDSSWGEIVLGVIFAPIVLPTLGTLGIYDYFEGGRDDARTRVSQFFNSIDWDSMKQNISEMRGKFLATLGGEAANNLMSILLEQAKDARGTKEEREKNLAATIKKIKEKETTLKKLKEDFSHLKSTLNS